MPGAPLAWRDVVGQTAVRVRLRAREQGQQALAADAAQAGARIPPGGGAVAGRRRSELAFGH